MSTQKIVGVPTTRIATTRIASGVYKVNGWDVARGKYGWQISSPGVDQIWVKTLSDAQHWIKLNGYRYRQDAH